MKFNKFLSILAAAVLTASPVSMNAFAEGDEPVEQPAQSDQTLPPDSSEIPTLTTAPQTTAATTTSTTTEITETTTTTTTTTSATTVPVTTTAAETPVNSVKVSPVCEHIIDTDINGRIVLEIPEGADADLLIEYASPEYEAHQYYKTTLSGGKTYYCDLEGRDVSADDYRIYLMKVSLKGGLYGIAADPYSDTITIPDGNDNPDSFRQLVYKFTIDNEDSDTMWNIVSDTGNEKEIAVHLNYLILGDVNEDTTVDASDASLVLSEYALLSTGGQFSFNAKQQKSADVNKDGQINSSDSSKILSYYAEISTGGKPSWD